MALGLAGASVFVYGEPHQLRWHPKPDELHFYRVSLKFDYSGAVLQFASNLKVKVLKVDPDGSFSIQTSTSGATVESGEEKRVLPDQAPVVQAYDPSGLPKAGNPGARDADPFSDLLNHLTEFAAPANAVKVGESWVSGGSDPKEGWFGHAKLTYTLADVFQEGGRHFAKIRYSAFFGGDPEAATGTLILDRTENALTELQAVIPHFRPEGTAEEAAVSVSIKERLPEAKPKSSRR